MANRLLFPDNVILELEKINQEEYDKIWDDVSKRGD